MSNRITAKQLNDQVREIADLLDLSTSKAEAVKKGQDRFLYLENAAVYGGWRLVKVNVENGGHGGAFGGNGVEARVKASEMSARLRGMVDGIIYAGKHFKQNEATEFRSKDFN